MSASTPRDYRVIIGLEIHVQLATATKMFCSCHLGYGETANSNVCPVCLGMPGVLPVINQQALEHSIRVGIALNCKIASYTKWDRKSYYYPDLPKNYQISQYDLPLSAEGWLHLSTNGEEKKIRIRRTHLEEDAGKNMHEGLKYSRVDLNRAGTPLLEIVTEPDLNSPQEARTFSEHLRQIVRYLGVSEGDMQKGQMRFEPNINLAIEHEGNEVRTPITEIKNLNSFRSLERSCEYEVERQLDEFLTSGVTAATGGKSTRGWDDGREVTVLQREKEDAHDYRYFPDPDLVPVELDAAKVEQLREEMVELPASRRQRFVREYGLSEYDAGVLTAQRSTAELFDEAVTGDVKLAKRVANLITGPLLAAANGKGVAVDEVCSDSQSLRQVAQLIDSGMINANGGNTLLSELVSRGGRLDDAEALAKELNLVQVSDSGELESLVKEVLSANAQAIEDFKSGGKKGGKARGFLLGQVMQRSQGKANPKVVGEILDKALR